MYTKLSKWLNLTFDKDFFLLALLWSVNISRDNLYEKVCGKIYLFHFFLFYFFFSAWFPAPLPFLSCDLLRYLRTRFHFFSTKKTKTKKKQKETKKTTKNYQMLPTIFTHWRRPAVHFSCALSAFFAPICVSLAIVCSFRRSHAEPDSHCNHSITDLFFSD